MKIRTIIFTITIASLIVFSCEKQESVAYHYNIFDVNWDPSYSDADADGYVTSAILNCLVNLEENVTRRVYGNVYYKPKTSNEYIFYSQTETKEFNGTNSPLLIQIPVGATKTELAYGTYDFVVEIFEEGAENYSTTSAIDTMFLATRNFEWLSEDQIFSISAQWKNELDNNEDGFVQSSVLYYDVNVQSNVEKRIYTELYVKEISAPDWTLLKSTSSYTISGAGNGDIDSIFVGRKPDELPNGQYNFKIVVYETGGFFPVAVLDNQSSDILKERKFQTLFDDSYYYSVDSASVNWQNISDIDGDSYIDSAVLEFDVNVDKPASRDIIAKLYVRHQDSLEFICFDSTGVFTIYHNNTTDKQKITVKAQRAYSNYNLHLDSAKYSFMISVFENVPYSKRIEMGNLGDTSCFNLYLRNFERP